MSFGDSFEETVSSRWVPVYYGLVFVTVPRSAAKPSSKRMFPSKNVLRAGPNSDGGGCSAGSLLAGTGGTGGKYKVRVAGDRCWAFSSPAGAPYALAEAADLVYEFHFDDPSDPKRADIYGTWCGV